MRPTFSISVAGSDITSDVSARFVSMDITDTVDENSDGMTLVLEDTTQDLALPKSGAKLEVSLGYDFQNVRIGSYVVDEVTVDGPPDLVNISASSTPFVTDRNGGGNASFTSRKNRSFEGKTIGEIIATVAGESGLSPVVDKTLKDVVIPHVSQVGESDSNLLVRLARRFGAVLKPADGRLVFALEAGGKTTSGQSLELTLTPSDVTTYRVIYGGKNQGVTKVKARVLNYQTGEDTEIEAEVKGDQFGE